MMLSKYVIILLWVRTNERFKNNPTSEKDYIVKTILHLSMGTSENVRLERRLITDMFLTEGWSKKINYIQIYIKYN